MSRLSKPLALALVVAGLALGARAQSTSNKPAASNKPTQLRWKFAKGQELQYQLVQDLTFSALGQNTTMTLDITWHVDAVDTEGAATLRYTIDRMRTRVVAGGQAPLQVDSAKTDADDEWSKRAAPVFEATIGQPGRMLISPRGKISDVELPEGMADKLKNSPALGQMGSLFNESFVKQMIESVGLELPEKAVSAGDTWTQSRDINIPGVGVQKVKTTFSFDGVENRGGRRLAKIAPEVEASLPDEKNIEVTNQDSSGAIYFDVASGKVSQSDVEYSVQFSLDVMGQKFTQEVGTVSTLKLMAGGEPKSDSASESKSPAGKEAKQVKPKPKQRG